MRAGNGLESFDAGKLPLERLVVIEAGAVDYLHRAVNAQTIASQPHLPIGARGDGAQQLVLRNRRQAEKRGLERLGTRIHASLQKLKQERRHVESGSLRKAG